MVKAWKEEIGAPDVLDCVHGTGETGGALVDAADFIQFTGSDRTGRKVMARAAETLTPVSLELGGKDPIGDRGQTCARPWRLFRAHGAGRRRSLDEGDARREAQELREKPVEVDTGPPTSDDSARSAARTNAPVPEPPFWGAQEVGIDLADVFPYLDRPSCTGAAAA